MMRSEENRKETYLACLIIDYQSTEQSEIFLNMTEGDLCLRCIWIGFVNLQELDGEIIHLTKFLAK